MENKENKDNKPILRDPLDSENAKEMEKKENSETLNRHLNDFKSICFSRDIRFANHSNCNCFTM